MVIDELFESLYEKAEDTDTGSAVYGKQVLASEEQVKALVALSHVFPQRLTSAITAIESRHCVRYECGAKHLWVIELVPVCLSHWVCSCKDFEQQLIRTPLGSSRWKRACRHLLAAHILEKRYPIIDLNLAQTVHVSITQMAALALDGTARVNEDDAIAAT